MAEEMAREVTETILDKSEPDTVRVEMAAFFERRAYNL